MTDTSGSVIVWSRSYAFYTSKGTYILGNDARVLSGASQAMAIGRVRPQTKGYFLCPAATINYRWDSVMLKSALFVGYFLAFGSAGVGTVAAAVDRPSNVQKTDAPKLKMNAWVPNEVHGAYNPAKQWAIVDVNDRFLIKSSPEGAGGKVKFAFLDGARAKIGTCSAAAALKPGERRTTWLQVFYTKPDADGKRHFDVRRTLDFNGHDRVYHFTARDGTLAALEPGVRVGLDHGVFVYEQTTGPIGTSGDTTAVRVTYQLSGQFGEINSSVEMNQDQWMVSTNWANRSGAPIYSVNNMAVLAYVPGMPDKPRDVAVVAKPARGSGIGEQSAGVALKVPMQQPFHPVENLEIDSSVKQDALCMAIRCLFDFECKGISIFCLCHEAPGPNLGVCLV